MSLEKEIKESARTIATDSYEMSVGELMNIYRDGELVVNPEFQRLFRWTPFQKSHLIESLLIGVPLPSIFVFEIEEGQWELIDGLQRVSTILEFAGMLQSPDGDLHPPLTLESTRYLPSLRGKTWGERGSSIGIANQIAIKRSRIGIQILKKSSDPKAKYDLFQRLNSHGSVATPQELRNSIIYMINTHMFSEIKSASKDEDFISLIHPSENQLATQGLMDFVTRFIVFMFVEYDKKWDIEEYLDAGAIELADLSKADFDNLIMVFRRTLDVIMMCDERDILRRFKDDRFQGKVGQAAFETIFLGVAQNIRSIEKRRNPGEYILRKAKSLWERSDVQRFTRAGLRGTDRITATIPFGKEWFST